MQNRAKKMKLFSDHSVTMSILHLAMVVTNTTSFRRSFFMNVNKCRTLCEMKLRGDHLLTLSFLHDTMVVNRTTSIRRLVYVCQQM